MKKWLSVIVVAAALVLGTGTPAAAARNYVNGAGTVTDDWGDEPLIGQGNYSNLVAMWQAILVADGELSWGDIDCDFGPATRSATIRWQNRKGLGADGIVGKNTWSKADNGLYVQNGPSVIYTGSYTRAFFWRHNDIHTYPYLYEVYVFNDRRPVWYDAATLPSC